MNGKIIYQNTICPYFKEYKPKFKFHNIGNMLDKFGSIFFNSKNKIKLIKPKNILVFKLDRIGDITKSIFFLKELKSRFNECKITLLVLNKNEDYAKLIPYVDKVLSVQINEKLYLEYKYLNNIFVRLFGFTYFMLFDFFKIIKLLRITPFDVGFDLVGRRRNALIMRFLKIKEIIGFNLPVFKFLFTKTLNYKENKNITLQQIDMISLIDGKDSNFSFEKINFKNIKNVTSKNIIGIHIGYGYENSRNWGVNNFSELIKLLLQKNYLVHIFYSKYECKEAKELKKSLEKNKNLKFFETKNILDYLNKLSKVEFFIGIDSGTSHMADVLGKKGIYLFSRESGIKWGPLNPNAYVLKGISKTCSVRNCKYNYCIKNISPQIVLDTIEKLR